LCFQAPKNTPQDLAALSTTCFKLNSLQLRALLSKYEAAPDEARLSPEVIENVVRVRSTGTDLRTAVDFKQSSQIESLKVETLKFESFEIKSNS